MDLKKVSTYNKKNKYSDEFGNIYYISVDANGKEAQTNLLFCPKCKNVANSIDHNLSMKLRGCCNNCGSNEKQESMEE